MHCRALGPHRDGLKVLSDIGSWQEKYVNSTLFLCVFTPRDDPEWYYAESLTTGKQGYIPYNFIAMSTVETEPYVSQQEAAR